MDITRQSAILLLTLASGIGIASSALANHPAVGADLGNAVHGDGTYRIVRIGPSTRHVHVVRGETVRFETTSHDGKTETFAWNFDTLGNRGFDLSRIAPNAALAGREVWVYVRRNPLIDGGR
jgi:hypothetical protein